MSHKNAGRTFEWMVIGAGPAGIGAIGKLLDAGLPGDKIAWCDPHFAAGDLGKKWEAVSSNTKVELFLKFLEGCKSFEYDLLSSEFAINHLNPHETCLLKEIADPLRAVTQNLSEKVCVIQGEALALNLHDNRWEVKTNLETFYSKNVILATGSDAKILNHPGKHIISIETALNSKLLQSEVCSQDVIGVFGSSHSAVLILANLMQFNVKKVINFYRSPNLYAVYLKDWILFDNTGLKGFAAKWARKNLDGTWPHNLQRMLSSDHLFEEALSECNKVIYAVGFKRRQLPVLEQFERACYNDKTGIIAPGLFGLGIAFPQAKFDPLMNMELRVGVWKFMDYLNEILPLWFQYANT